MNWKCVARALLDDTPFNKNRKTIKLSQFAKKLFPEGTETLQIYLIQNFTPKSSSRPSIVFKYLHDLFSANTIQMQYLWHKSVFRASNLFLSYLHHSHQIIQNYVSRLSIHKKRAFNKKQFGRYFGTFKKEKKNSSMIFQVSWIFL